MCVVCFLFWGGRGRGSASGGARGDGGESALECVLSSAFFFWGGRGKKIQKGDLKELKIISVFFLTSNEKTQ